MLACCTDADGFFLYHFPNVIDDRERICCSCKAVIQEEEPHALVGLYDGSCLEDVPPIELVMAADLTGISVSTGEDGYDIGWINDIIGEFAGEVAPPKRLCETCSDLLEAILERGFCYSPGENVRAIVKQIAAIERGETELEEVLE